jgi:hypothetical protein
VKLKPGALAADYVNAARDNLQSLSARSVNPSQLLQAADVQAQLAIACALLAIAEAMQPPNSPPGA